MADNSDLAHEQTHAGRAGELEVDALEHLTASREESDPAHCIHRALCAQTCATLAQSHRLASLADAADAIHDRIDDIKSRLP